MRFPTRDGRPRPPSLGQAAALGGLHGPVELLPVSSSGHIAALPWLLGWDYDRLDPEARKGFEVAVHAGTAAALLTASPPQLPHPADRRRLTTMALAAAPPAVAGLWLRPVIARRLGTAATIAMGLVAGSLLMLLADRAEGERETGDAGPVDGTCLGLAQACALAPGISRSGATLAVGRLRGFKPEAAAQLSHDVGLPVIVGAAALEAWTLRRRRLEAGWAMAMAAGAGAAFVSTLLAARTIRANAGRAMAPWAVYRVALAALILIRRRSGSSP